LTPNQQRKFSKYQAKLRTEPTKAELLVKDALEDLNLRFVFQKGFLRGKTTRIVDFYFPGLSVCLEVDGGYHELQKDKDACREAEICAQRKHPLRFIRITNDWVFKQQDLKAALWVLLF
jgi:very-short-patch-repair endonuclease